MMGWVERKVLSRSSFEQYLMWRARFARFGRKRFQAQRTAKIGKS